MLNIIYGLRDPRNDTYSYIGKSTVGNKRALSHLKISHSKRVNEWVEDLRQKRFEPLVDIIETVDDINMLAEREKYWVKHYFEINPFLLNSQLKPRNINLVVTAEERKDLEVLKTVLPNLHHLLKKERKVRKISQQEMAEKAGISLGTLKNLEQNRSHVGIEFFLHYIDALE